MHATRANGSDAGSIARTIPAAADVLLVEDDPFDIDLILLSLHRLDIGPCITVAHDGEEALDWLLGRGEHAGRPPARPKVVLLDLNLPGLDGIDLLARLKGDPATRTIPVVVLTGSSAAADVSACSQLGANSYVVKPLAFEGFAQAVEEIGIYWLHRNRASHA